MVNLRPRSRLYRHRLYGHSGYMVNFSWSRGWPCKRDPLYVVWWSLFLLTKQGQEQSSPNHVQALFGSPVISPLIRSLPGQLNKFQLDKWSLNKLIEQNVNSPRTIWTNSRLNNWCLNNFETEQDMIEHKSIEQVAIEHWTITIEQHILWSIVHTILT
jgi:hypothetical protein